MKMILIKGKESKSNIHKRENNTCGGENVKKQQLEKITKTEVRSHEISIIDMGVMVQQKDFLKKGPYFPLEHHQPKDVT